jgi:hypothetical protein
VFTERYALSTYIKQIRFVFKGLMLNLAVYIYIYIHTVMTELYWFKNTGPSAVNKHKGQRGISNRKGVQDT